MNKTRFITKNSIYEIADSEDSFQWTRTVSTGDSGRLRSDGGRATAFSHQGVGSPLVIYGPSLSSFGVRVVKTSTIVEIQEAVSVSF